MWVEITSVDAANNKKKVAARNATAAFILIPVTLFFAQKVGPYRMRYFSDALTWRQSFERLPLYLLLGIIAAAICYWVPSSNSSAKDSKGIVACLSCNMSKQGDPSKPCDCGGRLQHISLVKWVENPKI
jgi:hypothetical protein